MDVPKIIKNIDETVHLLGCRKTDLFAILTTKLGLSIIAGFSAKSL